VPRRRPHARGPGEAARRRCPLLDGDRPLHLQPPRPGGAREGGIRAAGGTPLEFNTVTINDGITMGTQGMKGSLVSREIIADSIELVGLSNYLDAVVALSGCDKTIPGTVMALARLDVPSLMIYAGSIMPGQF